MTSSRPDPVERINLRQAVQRFNLDAATAARIRALLNGMALRWRDQDGVWYRVGDVVAALAYDQDAHLDRVNRAGSGEGAACSSSGVDMW